MLVAIAVECRGVKSPALCNELMALLARDEQVRVARLSNWWDRRTEADMRTVNRENAACLDRLVQRHGWPGLSRVGPQASVAAWTLIEHADVETQTRYIDLMTAAADAGELSWSLLATTIDRMLVREGKRQRFGTQFELRNGKWVPAPIEDPKRVDERRARAGLRSLEEYTRVMQETYGKR